jgi:hypothetical protein
MPSLFVHHEDTIQILIDDASASLLFALGPLTNNKNNMGVRDLKGNLS